MAILIKNPEVERKARELASLRGLSITAALEGALDKALDDRKPKRRPTVAEMQAATERWVRRSDPGVDLSPVTRRTFDALWEDEPEPGASS